MNKVILILIGLLFFSCKTKENKESIDFTDRLDYIRKLNIINFSKTVGTSKNHKEYNKLDGHLRKIESNIRKSILNGESEIDLSSEYSFFVKQKFIDVSFWKSKKVNIGRALYILERLTVELGNSSLCSDFYLFDSVHIKCDTLGENEFLVGWEANSNLIQEELIYYINGKEKKIPFGLDEKSITLKDVENVESIGVIFRKNNVDDTVMLELHSVQE